MQNGWRKMERPYRSCYWGVAKSIDKAHKNSKKKHHEKRNMTSKVSLLRLMLSKKFATGESMQNHITEFFQLFNC